MPSILKFAILIALACASAFGAAFQSTLADRHKTRETVDRLRLVISRATPCAGSTRGDDGRGGRPAEVAGEPGGTMGDSRRSIGGEPSKTEVRTGTPLVFH